MVIAVPAAKLAAVAARSRTGRPRIGTRNGSTIARLAKVSLTAIPAPSTAPASAMRQRSASGSVSIHRNSAESRYRKLSGRAVLASCTMPGAKAISAPATAAAKRPAPMRRAASAVNASAASWNGTLAQRSAMSGARCNHPPTVITACATTL